MACEALPDRASRHCRRPRSVGLGLGRARRRERMGRYRARSSSRDGRRAGMGVGKVSHAPGHQSEPLSPRGHERGRRSSHDDFGTPGVRHVRRPVSRFYRSQGTRLHSARLSATRSRDRLAERFDGCSASQDPQRRRSTRRARYAARQSCPTLRRPSSAMCARNATRR
jgi:hypothetical protein